MKRLAILAALLLGLSIMPAFASGPAAPPQSHEWTSLDFNYPCRGIAMPYRYDGLTYGTINIYVYSPVIQDVQVDKILMPIAPASFPGIWMYGFMFYIYDEGYFITAVDISYPTVHYASAPYTFLCETP